MRKPIRPIALLLLALALSLAAPLSAASSRRQPLRIVSLTPAATEILFALGLGGEIVGVTSYCDYPPAAAGKEKIGDLNPNYEKIVSLRPNLLVAVGNLAAQTMDRLHSLGFTVAHYRPETIAAVMAAIENLGRETGRRAEAEHLTLDMRQRLDAVRKSLAGLEEADKPRVFVEIWMDPVMTAGAGTFTSELISLAGGRDIAYDAAPWSPFSPELVIQRNPQIIISQCASAAQIRQRPGWGGIDAVRNGRVHDVDQNIFSRPGPRLVEALEVLAALLHPGRYR